MQRGRGRGRGSVAYYRGGYNAHRSWTNPPAATPEPTAAPQRQPVALPHRQAAGPFRSKNRSLVVLQPSSQPSSETTHEETLQPSSSQSSAPTSGYIKQGMTLVRLDEHGQRIALPPPIAKPRRIKKVRRLRLNLNEGNSRFNAESLPLVADAQQWITKSKHSRQLISKEAIQKGLYNQSVATIISTSAEKKQKRTFLFVFQSNRRVSSR